jgi:hypothetical protein
MHQKRSSAVTNEVPEPIPKKLRQIEAFAKATIPLWPSSTWVPEKQNSIGEKTRSLKLESSTEPGASVGKNTTKSFEIFRSGDPEEWMLWRRDFNEVCVGLDVQTGAGCIRMVRQLLSDEPQKNLEGEFQIGARRSGSIDLPDQCSRQTEEMHQTRTMEARGLNNQELLHQDQRAQRSTG